MIGSEQERAWMNQAIETCDGTPADAAARFEALIKAHVGPFEIPTLEPHEQEQLDAEAVADTLHAHGLPDSTEELSDFELAMLSRSRAISFMARVDSLHPLIRKELFARRAAAFGARNT